MTATATLLNNKITVYLPSKFLSQPAFVSLRDKLVGAAGGVTIDAGKYGYWNDANGVTVGEPVATVVAMCTDDATDNVGGVVAELVTYLKAEGEQAVLVEATGTDEETTWAGVIYA